MLEVDGDRHDRGGGRFEVGDPALLVLLRRRVVDLEDGGRGDFGIRQARVVEAGTEHDYFARGVRHGTASSIAMVRGTISRPVRRTSS